MTAPVPEWLFAQVENSTILAKLDTRARQLTGFGLALLLPSASLAFSLRPAGKPAVMPPFCQLVQSSPQGQKLCATCHSLMAFGACNLGVTEHTCYNGVHVIGAGINDPRGELPGAAVISSCDFTKDDRAVGWRAARTHARKIHADVAMLKEAYFALPHLTAGKRALLESVVDFAATAFSELLNHPPAADRLQSPALHPSLDIGQTLRSDLFLARDRMFRQRRGTERHPLVEAVKSIVSRHPAMPFTVQDIAQAAHMSPNHFSNLFSRFAGKSFVKFLNEKRLSMAEELLCDPTMGIKQVAEKSGFEDANYFARLFRRTTGMSPRRWRENL